MGDIPPTGMWWYSARRKALCRSLDVSQERVNRASSARGDPLWRGEASAREASAIV